MSSTLTFNVDSSRTLDKAVVDLRASIGTIIVTATDDPEVLAEGKTKKYKQPKAGLTLYSPHGSQVVVTYWDEVD